MTKIRRFDVKNDSGKFSFMVDNKPSDAAEMIEAMNSYQNELDDLDNTIGIIMRSLRTTHNLSDDEYASYEQTLKIILKD